MSVGGKCLPDGSLRLPLVRTVAGGNAFSMTQVRIITELPTLDVARDEPSRKVYAFLVPFLSSSSSRYDTVGVVMFRCVPLSF